MEKYYLLKVQKCPICGGKGVVQGHDWGKLWNQYLPDSGVSRFEEKEKAQIESFLIGDGKNFPNEIECPNCYGTGEEEKEFPLTEKILKILLPMIGQGHE